MSRKSIRLLAIICLLLVSNSSFAESVIDLDQFPESAEAIHYMVTEEEAYKYFCSYVDEESGFFTFRLILDQANEGWDIKKYYYSPEKHAIMIAYMSLMCFADGYEPRYYCNEYSTPEEFLKQLNDAYYCMTMTQKWELEYGPYQFWSVDLKRDFYEMIGMPATDSFQVPHSPRGYPVWGMPEKNQLSEEEARKKVYDCFEKKCNTSSEILKFFNEDVRYIRSTDEAVGFWEFRYWCKVKKGDQEYWYPIIEIIQVNDLEFGYVEKINQDYMQYFFRDLL